MRAPRRPRRVSRGPRGHRFALACPGAAAVSGRPRSRACAPRRTRWPGAPRARRTGATRVA
jgi:hypothetical protein